ncbi:MAG: hypothetical protein HQL08_16415 [Nitrospirae bacterium]|nr:hypothetical protein [Nitrospirota bacterium]
MVCFDEMRDIKKVLATVLLMLFVASAYAQTPFPSMQTSDTFAEKAGHTKWEVQGSIGNKVVIVNGRGDTSAVEAGSEIDGCLVTAGKVIWDAAEKEAISKSETETKEREGLGKTEIELGKRLAHHTMVSIIETRGKNGYSPDLGHIKFAVLDGKLIIRVIRSYYDKAETILKEAILEEAQDNGFVYYGLDVNMVQVEYK